MTADLPGGFDDLGDAAVGRPEHPAVQFGPGLVAVVWASSGGVP